MTGGLVSYLRSMRRQREGAVAAEFALVAPLFFSLVMGGVEFSSVVYAISSMQLAANIAARDIEVNTLPCFGPGAAGALSAGLDGR